MSLIEFFSHNTRELLALTFEHLFLVAVSTGIAILIGVPLGILLTRKPGLSKPVLGFANIMQTVPSLALFGFLIPLNIYLFHVKIVGGIGARTAIVALVLYALLPIIRNTFTGISNVDPAIRDAGRGMGMTDRQLLLQVELPLALGVIIAGVRVATVICVGTATIAAAIDAGGLGRYIFRGLARQRQHTDPGRRGAGGVDRHGRGSGARLHRAHDSIRQNDRRKVEKISLVWRHRRPRGHHRGVFHRR